MKLLRKILILGASAAMIGGAIGAVKSVDAAKADGEIPETYQRLKYITSDGIAYIDTGVIPNNTIGFKIKISVPDVSTDTFRLGDRVGTNGRFNLGTQGGKFYVGWDNITGNASSFCSQTNIVANTPYEISVNYLNDRKFRDRNYVSSEDLPELSTRHTQGITIFSRRTDDVSFNTASSL